MRTGLYLGFCLQMRSCILLGEPCTSFVRRLRATCTERVRTMCGMHAKPNERCICSSDAAQAGSLLGGYRRGLSGSAIEVRGRAAFDPCGGKHEHQPSRVSHSRREVQDRRRHQRASDAGTHSCVAELQFLKPAILQNVWCEELMESCLSADAWPKRRSLLSDMGSGRASGDSQMIRQRRVT